MQGWTAPTLTGPTATALAAGVTHGQTVRIQWTAAQGAGFPTSISASNGSKTVVLDNAEVTADGRGSYYWTVSDKLPPGSGWRLTVANGIKGASSSVQSAAFTVSANPTTLAKNIPA